MKAIRHLIAGLMLAGGISGASAQFFDHLGANVQAGTNGITVEAVTNITNFVNMRVGADFMPGITFNSDADFILGNTGDADFDGMEGTVDLEGGLKRTQGHVIFNFYPIPKAGLFVAVGAYFGGNKLVKIEGHSEQAREYLQKHPEAVATGGAVIGDVTVPFNTNGDVSGGLKVNNFRPYFGIGWGRALPGKRVNFGFELGVQVNCKPELYTNWGDLDTSVIEDDNTYQKIMKHLKVYPVMSFKLQFRAI